MSSEDLQEFYENIDFDIVESFSTPTPSPSSTIKLKHIFPITAEAISKTVRGDEVDLVDQVGQGGQKIVYKGLLHSDNRNLALAFMNEVTDLDEVENFFREARISMSLRHPSIVQTYDFGIDEVYGPYSVMEWVEGENLHHILRAIRHENTVYRETFSLQKLVAYYVEVCKAVSFAHSKDIIHLDIKPENIMVDYCTDRAMLFDWGLAKAFSPLENFEIDPLLLNNETKSGYFRGTPGYMPPEQIKDQKKNVKTDIYQLGALLYTIVFKHCPVEGDDVEEILEKTLKGEIFVDSISKENLPLITICKKAMSPDPDDRYECAREIISDIESIKYREPQKSNWKLALAFAAIIPIMIVLGTFWVFDTDEIASTKLSSSVEVQPILKSEPSVAVSLLMPEDIALMEEFSEYDSEIPDEAPLYFSNNPLPNWYSYLNDLLNSRMQNTEEADSGFFIRNFLISFNQTEDGL